MILCFSGTGNSRFVARELAKILDERVIELQGEEQTESLKDAIVALKGLKAVGEEVEHDEVFL